MAEDSKDRQEQFIWGRARDQAARQVGTVCQTLISWVPGAGEGEKRPGRPPGAGFCSARDAMWWPHRHPGLTGRHRTSDFRPKPHGG